MSQRPPKDSKNTPAEGTISDFRRSNECVNMICQLLTQITGRLNKRPGPMEAFSGGGHLLLADSDQPLV